MRRFNSQPPICESGPGYPTQHLILPKQPRTIPCGPSGRWSQASGPMHGSSIRPSTRHSPADRSDTFWRNRVLLSRCSISPTCSIRPSNDLSTQRLTSLPCMPRVERINPATASKRNTFDQVFGLQSVSCISHLVCGALCCSPLLDLPFGARGHNHSHTHMREIGRAHV